MLKEFRQPLLTLLFGLSVLFVYALQKSPFVFPGLQERVQWVLLPVLALTILSYVNWKLLAKVKYAGTVIRYVQTHMRVLVQKKAAMHCFFVLLSFGLLATFLSSMQEFLRTYQTPFLLLFLLYGGLVLWHNKEAIAAQKVDVPKTPALQRTIVGCLLLLATVLYMYNLGGADFREDEFQVVETAVGYFHTGELYKWNFFEGTSGDVSCKSASGDCYYDRAWPHTILISFAYDLFGISEWSSRIVSALFGILAIVLLYFITAFFTSSRAIALFTAVTLLLSKSYIDLFRYTRMYALLVPLFLILVYVTYRTLTEKNVLLKRGSLHTFLTKHLCFNYAYAALIPLLLLPLFIIHINSLVLLPSILLFVLLLAYINKEHRYVVLGGIGVFGLLVVALFLWLTDANILRFLSFFARENTSYLVFFTDYPFGSVMGSGLLLLGLFSLFLLRNPAQRQRLLYLYTIIAFSLLFFIYIANRYSGFVYVSHIIPLALMLMVYAFWTLAMSYKPVVMRALLCLLLLVSILLSFSVHIDALYAEENGRGKFSVAYQTISSQPADAVFGQYLRGYYLQNHFTKNRSLVNMKYNKQYAFATFLEDLEKYDSGWITWESRKQYHLDRQIVPYLCAHFEQHHGDACGVALDATNVEVFYFDKSMVRAASVQRPLNLSPVQVE